MNVEDRQKAYYEFSEEQSRILLGKGYDYTAGRADEDAYANFRIVADLLRGVQITSYTVALVYFLKHVLSLISYAKRGCQESGESLRGRHLDIANYAFILDQLKDDHLLKNQVLNIKTEGEIAKVKNDFKLYEMGLRAPAHKDGPVFAKSAYDPFNRKPAFCKDSGDCKCEENANENIFP